MALPHVFANVTELDTPALDDNFNAVGALGVIPCVASGTNSITLTPAANTPTISAYTNNAPEFSFEAASTSSAALLLQVLGLGLKNVYKNNGATAAGANDFLASSTYKVTYNSALNASAGGWVILNQGASSASAGSVQGAFKKLKVQTTSDTAIAVTADQLAVSDGSNAFTTIFAASLTIATGTVGANGIDTGSVSSSTWYYVYAIYNVNTGTAAGLMSLSSTAPTLPGGYAQFARVGAVITDGSAHLLRTLQYNRQARYIVGTNPTAAVAMLAASATTSAWTSLGVGSFVPPTASQISVYTYNNTGTASSGLAPNASYGTVSALTNQPPLVDNGGASGTAPHASGLLLLESTNIYYYTTGSAFYIWCYGWEDNL